MKAQILELLVSMVPFSYGVYLYVKLSRITKKSTEEELIELDGKLTHMKRSATIFTLIGAYMIYQFYKHYFA